MRASNPRINAIANVGSGSDINSERLIKTRPDVVITWAVYPELVNFMSRKGLKVLAFNPHNLDEVWRDLKIQATVMGKPKAANAAIHESRKLLKEIRGKVQRIHNPKTVLWLWGKPTSIVGSDGVTADILRRLHVNNPGSQYPTLNPDIGLEKLIRLNPDVILIWGSAKYGADDILNNPQLRTVKAVRNRQVFKAPNWGTWSPRAASLTLWAATKIYPEYFDARQSQSRIAAFHKKVFGVNTAE